MDFRRPIGQALSNYLDRFPAVLVTGPRQSGKTTLCRQLLAGAGSYVNLDDPHERAAARSDPVGFLARFGRARVVIDEFQYVAELLPTLEKQIREERSRMGRFVLIGSQRLRGAVSFFESLAGRVAAYDLLPFSLLEARAVRALDLGALVWGGFYPKPLLRPEARDEWVRSYFQIHVQRDVRRMLNVRDGGAFETFFAFAAARHGQICNASDLARDVGISVPTALSWIGLLEASFVAYRLPAFSKNIGKRLVKTPRLYFLDPGIVADATRQPSPEAALAGPMGGSLFEGIIVSETLKIFASLGKKPEICFFRTGDGTEVDLLVRIGDLWHPVEIKLTSTPTSHHLAPMRRLRELVGAEIAPQGVLVCRVGKEKRMSFGNIALPWQRYSDWLVGKLEGT